MCIGGSSANTDRKQQLGDYGRLNATGDSLSATGGNLTSAGTSDTGTASRYFSSLLSGNPAAVRTALAPETSAITGAGETQKRELAQPGDRAGGTNAAQQDIQTSERGQIADVTSKVRTGAATQEGRIGLSELGEGIGATSSAGNLALGAGDLATRSRALSAQLHAAAVRNWSTLISDVFTGKGALAAGGTWEG